MKLIHREGNATLTLVFAILLAVNLIVFFCCKPYLWFSLLLSTFLSIFFLQFFRNPSRPIAIFSDELVYAPADGKVVVIERTQENEYFKAERLQISIFMSPLNVHVNRSPIAGVVKYVRYHAGKYLVAWHPKASTENERTSIVIANKRAEILLRQIAGALAKRIIYYPKEGEHLQQGQEFGFIKFGSRVDIFLPLSAEVKVSIGQKVSGNIDILAKI